MHSRAVFGALLLVLSLTWVLTGACPQSHATPPPPSPAMTLDQQVTPLEYGLYGQSYVGQPLGKRLDRLEKSLFGLPQAGITAQRIQQIQKQLDARTQAAEAEDPNRLLDYLERKFFTQTFDPDPLTTRLDRLETHVFGHTFAQTAPPDRLKRLAYQVPLHASKIRVWEANGPSPGSVSGETPRVLAPETLQLDMPNPQDRTESSASPRSWERTSQPPGGVEIHGAAAAEVARQAMDVMRDQKSAQRLPMPSASKDGIQRFLIRIPVDPKSLKQSFQESLRDGAVTGPGPDPTMMAVSAAARMVQVPTSPAGLSNTPGRVIQVSAANPVLTGPPPSAALPPAQAGPVPEKPSQLAFSTQAGVLPPALESPPDVKPYLDSLFRLPSGEWLQWSRLPVQVFFQGEDGETRALGAEAMALWGKALPLARTETLPAAQVVVNWAGPPLSTTPITRPILTMNAQGQLQTRVYINLGPFQSWPLEQRRHLFMHQLGHALGLWGHSPNPKDMMYPATEEETRDLPSAWQAGVTELVSGSPPLSEFLQTPSPDDLATLRLLYQQPGRALGAVLPP